MALYIHIGCMLNGRTESTNLIDGMIHRMALIRRLEIMEAVLAL